MPYTPIIEKESIAQQETIQLKKLNELLIYLKQNSPFYQQKFKENNFDLTSIDSLKLLEKIPTTSKDDLQNFNFDFLCVPKKDIIEYTSTSGTLGSPVTIALTENDLKRLAYNEYLSFTLMKINDEDVVQLLLTLDRQFMAGMAYYLGLKQLGATSIRTGAGLPSMQLETAKRLGATALVTVPSFLIKLINHCEAEKIDLQSFDIKKILCIGENIRDENFELNALGKKINEHWKLQFHSTYASTEMQTAFTECEYGVGGHHHPELMIVEILDDDGNQLKAGEYGEVTITTLGVEGMPLLRYRTGDICCYYDEPCKCGRKTVRLSPVVGRKKQMIKYKGTTIYPPSLYDVLNEFSGINEFVVEVNHDAIGNDELTFHINTSLSVDECEKNIKPFLKSKLRVVPLLNYVSSSEIHEMQFKGNSRKPIKFVDNRKHIVA